MQTERTCYRFLKLLFAPYPTNEDLCCEIRCLRDDPDAPSGKRISQKWFEVGNRDEMHAAAAHCWQMREEWDVYAGVLPREWHGASMRDTRYGGWLWIDVDRGGGEQANVLPHLHAARLPRPHMVTLSGSGGLHVYWRLRQLRPLADDAARQDYRATLRRIVAKVGGGLSGVHADIASTDPARILRVAATLNHKHDPPRPVQAVLCRSPLGYGYGEPHSYDWWRENLPPTRTVDEEAAARAIRRMAWQQNQQQNQQAGDHGALLTYVQRPRAEGGRHSSMAKDARWLVRDKGVPKPDIESALLVSARNSAGGHPVTPEEIRRIVAWA